MIELLDAIFSSRELLEYLISIKEEGCLINIQIVGDIERYRLGLIGFEELMKHISLEHEFQKGKKEEG